VNHKPALPGSRHERPFDQGAQHGQPGPGDGFGGVAREPAAKDAQLHEDALLVSGEPLPRVFERRPHAALAFGDVAQFGFEKIQAGGDLLRDLDQRQHAQPARRQHQRQRHPLDQPADADDVADVAVVHFEAGVGQASRLDQ